LLNIDQDCKNNYNHRNSNVTKFRVKVETWIDKFWVLRKVRIWKRSSNVIIWGKSLTVILKRRNSSKNCRYLSGTSITMTSFLLTDITSCIYSLTSWKPPCVDLMLCSSNSFSTYTCDLLMNKMMLKRMLYRPSSIF
jgi:hypothetical protein